jgi:hypothetical protein
MQLFMFLIDSNNLHVSGVTRPSSGAQELCMQPKSCISLVPYMIFICKDARFHEHKKKYTIKVLKYSIPCILTY